MRTVTGLIEFCKDRVDIQTVPKGRYLTVKEYAAKFRLCESTVRTDIARGKIPSYFWMGQRLIPADFKPKISQI